MRHGKPIGLILFLVVLGLLVFFGPALAGLYTDWLWFGEVGQRGVFWTMFSARAGLGLLFGLALTAIALVNVLIARRSTPQYIPRPGAPEWQYTASLVARRGLTAMLVLGSVVLGVMGALVAATQWDTWLRFANAQPFGTRDPVFQQDIGFYVFQLPFLEFVAGWLFTTLLLVTIATAAVYYVEGAIDFTGDQPRIAGAVRTHLSILLGFALLVKAWDYWLDRYDLLFETGRVLTGAGYTDLHARLPALNILMVVAAIAAFGFFLNARIRALWLPGLALAVLAVTGITVGGFYPSMVQRFTVAPDEASKEAPYIQRHIEASRQAYGLDRITTEPFVPSQALTASDMRTEAPTLTNIRLWDYRVLGQTYQRLQGLRQYYNVANVDIDRYVIDGNYRQVMLAPREMVTDRLPQRRWVNETLQYTHGYGLVMSAVNAADPQGRPVWLVSDLPLKLAPGLELPRPQFYYGMVDNPPVIAPSRTPEFDYPQGDEGATSRYEGSGGIPLSSGLNRTLFSGYMGSMNVLISDQVTPESRALIRRNVRERVATLAPFLKYDFDPYVVVHDGGLVWIQDAYTLADTYPYSESSSFDETALLESGGAGMARTSGGDFNYIRNSVKIVVDGYSGAITLYAMDEQDPVLAAYRKAFPGLFRDAAEMPENLRAHVRYPEDLFTLQSRKLTRFHVTNPRVFYAQEDVWEIPAEQTGVETGGGVPMQPYYVMMRLPGESKEEFALILPFRTRAGTTMPGWLVGRCDGENYGQLRLYEFPTSIQVDAPDQVENAMGSDMEVSQTVTLLSQQGSDVRFGNLLVLPVGKTLLYVKPMYVEARDERQGGIPVLKQVILAEKRGAELRVVMEPTLTQALSQLVGAPVPEEETPAPDGEPAPAGPAAAAPPGLARLASEASAALEAAERAQRAGNWAEYGRQMERVRSAIQRMRQQAGGGSE